MSDYVVCWNAFIEDTTCTTAWHGTKQILSHERGTTKHWEVISGEDAMQQRVDELSNSFFIEDIVVGEITEEYRLSAVDII